MSTDLIVQNEPSEITLAEMMQEQVDRLADEKERRDIDEMEWFMRTMSEIEANEALIKAQYDRLKSQLKARRDALVFFHGDRFRDDVDRLLQKQTGNRKSVDLFHGRAGYRKPIPKVAVEDKDAAVQWAIDNLPAAVKCDVSLTSLKAYVKETGEVPPGIAYSVPKDDQFFPSLRTKTMTADEIKGVISGSDT
jgi:hypothetical protein